MKYKNDLVLWIIGATIAITGLLIYVHPFADFFEFEHLNFAQLVICIGVGFVSVIWIELLKWKNRKMRLKA